MQTTLAYPAKKAELILQTDASDTCVGAVLQQIVNGTIQPLGFYSKALTTTQQKYSTIDRELTGIYQAVQHFSPLLDGHAFSSTLTTNH